MYIVNRVMGIMYVWRQEKSYFTVSLFEQLVQGVFCSRGISLHVEKAVAVCILANGSTRYHVHYKSEIGLVLRDLNRERCYSIKWMQYR